MMPSAARNAPALDLPPPYSLVRLRELGDAFSHATSIAMEGAGTLVHVGRFDLAEFAVVLEPAEPLRIARRALYVGLCALGDALAAHAPPEKAIGFEWPDRVCVDGGLVGGVRLGWPRRSDEDEPPPWLVFGGMIRTVAESGGEPGLRPLATALEEEGFGDLGAGRLVESFSRHLMVAFDRYQEKGFDEVARAYLARVTPEDRAHLDIDENGDLLIRRVGVRGIERRPLISALANPSWLDPVEGGPR
jgi:biotin-(acetyl-CoA carboxylase) ligase